MSKIPRLARKLVGDLPKEWRYARFKELYAKPIRDFGSFSSTKLITFLSIGVPFIKSEMIHRGKIDWTNAFYISEDVHQQLDKSHVHPGNILFSKIGSALGKAVVYRGDKGVCNSNAAVGKIELDPRKHDPQFFTELLNSQIAERQFRRLIISLLPRLNLGDISSLYFPVPPLPEQQKIAAILSTWDRAVELTEKLIVAKQKRKQALIQQLLTGKVRFREFVKSKNRQKTPIGNMPSDWKTHRLGKIVEKVKRKNPDGEVHVLTASGEHGLVDQREFFNRSVAGADLSGYYLLKRGEFAYNRSAMKGYPFGAIKRLDRYEQGVLSTLYICFGISDDRCDPDYLSQFFEARILDKQLRGITQVGGRAHGLLNITDGDFYSMSVTLPSVEEQQKISAVLDGHDKEIEVVRRKLEALKQQKKGLMQRLLTGKVRVTCGVQHV